MATIRKLCCSKMRTDRACWKVRRRDVLHELLDGDFRIVDQCAEAAYDLPQVVRRNVRGNAHRNARGSINQQMGHTSRQHSWLPLHGDIKTQQAWP